MLGRYTVDALHIEGDLETIRLDKMYGRLEGPVFLVE